MDRVVRIIGVAIVVALPIGAHRAFDRAVSAEPTEAADRKAGQEEGHEEGHAWRGSSAGRRVEARDAAGDPPRALPFGLAGEVTGAREARVYLVGAATGERSGPVEPVEDERSDYPVETELVTGFSLAPVDFIEPGLYASSFEAEECSYELRRVDPAGHERPIGHDRLRRGRLLVSINAIEPDVFTSDPRCHSWSPWSPLVEPLVQAPVGDYWVGDLARGSWSVPEGCLWEKVVAFRGARLADVTDSGRGPKTLLIDEDTVGVRIRDCDRAIVLAEAEPAPGLGLEPGLHP